VPDPPTESCPCRQAKPSTRIATSHTDVYAYEAADYGEQSTESCCPKECTYRSATEGRMESICIASWTKNASEKSEYAHARDNWTDPALRIAKPDNRSNSRTRNGSWDRLLRDGSQDRKQPTPDDRPQQGCHHVTDKSVIAWPCQRHLLFLLQPGWVEVQTPLLALSA
jgi:hypothetical protein